MPAMKQLGITTQECEHATTISCILDDSINYIVANRAAYVVNPDKDFIRNRMLPMDTIMKIMITSNGGSIQENIQKMFDKEEKNGLIPIIPTIPAFVKQRDKIKPNAYYDLFIRATKAWEKASMLDHYKGFRVMAIDGTDINIYPHPEDETFIKVKDKAGYSQYHATMMCDVLNSTYHDIVVQKKHLANEIDAAKEMIQRDETEKCIYVMDRYYFSYDLAATIIEKSAFYVIRAKGGEKTALFAKDLPSGECDVEVPFEIVTSKKGGLKKDQIFQRTPSKKAGAKNSYKATWSHGNHFKMTIRVVRFTLKTGEYETIYTNLPRDGFSVEAIKDLYNSRWGIETSFRNLKYPVGAAVQHSKKLDAALSEIYAKVISYNLIAFTMLGVSVKQEQRTKYHYAPSFKMACYCCICFFRSKRRDALCLLYNIKHNREAVRPGREDKRKIIPKRFIPFPYRILAA